MAAAAAAAATTEHAPPPPPTRSASCAATSLVFEAMEGSRGEGAGGPTDLSQDMAACEQRIAQGRGRTAEAAFAFDGAILFARSLAQYGGLSGEINVHRKPASARVEVAVDVVLADDPFHYPPSQKVPVYIKWENASRWNSGPEKAT
ncbi:hypothetical protein ZWY2020_048037 [Hordeum vulgare]|nr:hypothetical protein ZWY2020_048037 [Hordeum vulgare]